MSSKQYHVWDDSQRKFVKSGIPVEESTRRAGEFTRYRGSGREVADSDSDDDSVGSGSSVSGDSDGYSEGDGGVPSGKRDRSDSEEEDVRSRSDLGEGGQSSEETLKKLALTMSVYLKMLAKDKLMELELKNFDGEIAVVEKGAMGKLALAVQELSRVKDKEVEDLKVEVEEMQERYAKVLKKLKRVMENQSVEQMLCDGNQAQDPALEQEMLDAVCTPVRPKKRKF